MSTEPRLTPHVDAHQHFWDLTVRPQPWTDGLPIARSYFYSDLEPGLDAAGVDGTVLVETVDVSDENAEFLAIAAAHPRVLGVVGWVDLTAPDVADALARAKELPGAERLVGIRHVVQGEPDPAWLARPDVLRGLAAVADAGLVYDLLVLPHQLPAAIEAVERTPHGRFVLDHLAKPLIRSGGWEPWASDFSRLAALPNVACKLSGMVTEAADWTNPVWSVAQLRPYAEHALAAFGPDRLMAGSDWPVCLLVGSYADTWSANEQLVAGLSADERDAVLGGTAASWYGLPSEAGAA